MSEEFEKIVLEKLGNIENTLDKHSKILNEHTEILNKHSKILNEHTEILNKHSKILMEHTVLLNEHSSILEKHTRKLDEHYKLIQQNEKAIKELTETCDVHNKYFIKYEYDFNEKFQALMDLISMAEDKHTIYDDTMLHYNAKFLDHDIRISVLEDLINEKTKVQTITA